MSDQTPSRSVREQVGAPVLVLVSPELVNELGQWGAPVQVKILMTCSEPGYTMVARPYTTPNCRCGAAAARP